MSAVFLTGLLSNQGEESINFYFIMVSLRKNNKSMVLQSPVKGIGISGLESWAAGRFVCQKMQLPLPAPPRVGKVVAQYP